METVPEVEEVPKVAKPMPWDWMDLTENALNRALTGFNLSCQKKISAPFESVEEEKFYYYLLGRNSVQSWDLRKPYIITSGLLTDQTLASSPAQHRRVPDARKEAERLSKKHKDTPFYIWGAVGAYVNGQAVQFSPALHQFQLQSTTNQDDDNETNL